MEPKTELHYFIVLELQSNAASASASASGQSGTRLEKTNDAEASPLPE
jgi:hypothetical protein